MHDTSKQASPSPAQTPVDDARTTPPAGPCTMVIFGASGDLTKRKLLPALYNLRASRLLSTSIRRHRRGPLADDRRRVPRVREARISASCRRRPKPITRWSTGSCSACTTCRSTSSDPACYAASPPRTAPSTRSHGTGGNVLYYLATAPELFADIVRQLGDAGLTGEQDGCWRRVIVEKPFGHDLDSARALNRELLAGAPRDADLPHRSLPRQGDRPEHPGVPLRQRHLRADLEPPLHRPRADHRRPRRSASRGAAATTTSRARCATWCRTTCSS